jgi:hypothetical protein
MLHYFEIRSYMPVAEVVLLDCAVQLKYDYLAAAALLKQPV